MDFSTLNPPNGWVDMFNGLRTPVTGSASSFEELLSLVITMKEKSGIVVRNHAVEEAELKTRFCRLNPDLCRSRGGPRAAPGCCGD